MIGKFELNGRDWQLDYVDRCPHCYQHASLEVIAAGKSPELNECGVTFYCRHCKRLSFADLVLTGVVLNDSSTKLIASYPDPEQLPLPRGIELYFPAFRKIYEQAHRAELAGLNEVVGMAYRKALENLVKNYLAEAYPSEEQTILSEPLGKSIGRIEYPRIKALAKVAAWIGNDEAHMLKKNPNYGVADMKDFIFALCHLILAEKIGDKAVDRVARN